MKRIVIAVRIVLILVLLSGIGALMMQRNLSRTVDSLDSRFLPVESSLQAHAERLALHISNRLMQPPLPVLPDSLDVPVDSLKYASLNLPPNLETADLPARHPLSWSKSQGWLSDPPPVKQVFLERFFMRSASRPIRPTPTMTTLVMDPPDRDTPMILAGTWSFANEDASFHGALTPVDAFYDHYVQRWFDEYCHATYGLMLKTWAWKPVEFRFLPHDTDREPIVLRASQTVDTDELFPENGLIQFSSEAAELAAKFHDNVNPDPNWWDGVELYEGSLFPIPDKILVATPFQMDILFAERSQLLTWWTVVSIIFVIVLLPLTWLRRNVS
jgi:hypothetical protein